MLFLILLNIIFVFLVCSLLKDLSVFYIIYFALIVINSQILSLFSIFNILWVSVVSTIQVILLCLYFIRTKSKVYFPPLKTEFIKLKNSLKSDLLLRITFFVFLFMLLSFFVLAIITPPLEPDSRMYHFVRIFYYIKQQNFHHFDTSQIRNIVMPFNSEIIYSYFYLFKRNVLTADLGFGLISYFSFINVVFQIYLISRHLKFSVRKTLFAILVLSSMGAVLVQVSSLQTDIVIASLILSSVYLLLKYEKNQKNLYLFLSSLSYALAIGTKTTAIIIFPAYLVFLFYVLKNKTYIFKYLLFLFINFLVFASYNYILNFLDFKDFISPISLKAEHAIYYKGEIKDNFYWFFRDFLGHRIAYLLNFTRNYKTDTLFDERTVGFSFLGCLIFIPAIIFSITKRFYKTKNRRIKYTALFSFLFLINFVVVCFNFTYSPFIIRYFVTFVLLSSFCMAELYKINLLKNLVLIYCIFEMILYSFISTRYPLYYVFRGIDKETIMLKEQNDSSVRIQYEFLNIFKNSFKKEDKIAILDEADFYEIKQLMNFGYDIDVVILDKISKESLSKYDYLIFRYYNESSNNSLYFDMKKPKFKCEYYIKTYKNKSVPIAKKCYFDGKILNNSGFYFYKKIEVENKSFHIYVKTPKNSPDK